MEEPKPETLAERLSAAVRILETTLTAPDEDVPAAEKQTLLTGILVRVAPDGERVVTTFRTGTVFLVCTNERPPDAPLPCCAARGSRDLLAAFQAELARRGYPSGVKVSGSTCLTSCQCGPTVAVFPEGIWYGKVTEADVAELFDAHLSGRGPVERLLLPDDVRVW
jgi:(2Fe-2S) ferredoxin